MNGNMIGWGWDEGNMATQLLGNDKKLHHFELRNIMAENYVHKIDVLQNFRPCLASTLPQSDRSLVTVCCFCFTKYVHHRVLK